MIQLPKIVDERDNITFFESNNHVAFEIKNTYWIYDVPSSETSGWDVLKKQNEFIIALLGSFDVAIQGF